ncbi:hypothetical protein SprV_0902745900 [Sparganum proliferum]
METTFQLIEIECQDIKQVGANPDFISALSINLKSNNLVTTIAITVTYTTATAINDVNTTGAIVSIPTTANVINVASIATATNDIAANIATSIAGAVTVTTMDGTNANISIVVVSPASATPTTANCTRFLYRIPCLFQSDLIKMNSVTGPSDAIPSGNVSALNIGGEIAVLVGRHLSRKFQSRES